ncbi:hypothetical protein GEA64_08045 [Photorhabdus khanii]|uniref:Uncharacterized protein n=1 Tax=Photorhabdus khanii TaxID=1004150 RepID=A0A7C9GIN6_9GAMM|nr:hypothetical protein [Photorhabdus khanii]MQL47936.1 hypothetical protein [Photorhabdus khanii]
MNKIFTWIPDENQTYDKENGTQIIESSPPYHFDKFNNTHFTMDAGNHKLTLEVNNINNHIINHNISWPNNLNTGPVAINIFSGKLVIDCISAIKGIQSLPSFSFGSNQNEKQKSTIIFKNSAAFHILGPGDVVIGHVKSLPAINMSESSEFVIIQNLNHTISLSCSLDMADSSNLTFVSKTVFIPYANITLKDNTQMHIFTQALSTKNPLIGVYLPNQAGIPFNLGAGAPELKIMSADGNNYPLKLNNTEYPQGLFNFMTQKGENTGKVVIDVAPQDANVYGLNTILRQNLIARDGEVLNAGDQMKYFDFSYGKDARNGNQVGTITISLRNLNLQLS